MSDESEKNKRVALSNSDRNKLAGTGDGANTLLKQALASLNAEDANELSKYLATKAIDLKAQEIEQQIKLGIATKDIENHIEAWFMLQQDSGKLTRNKMISDLESGAGKIRIESKSGASCFVATVCLGNIDHPDLQLLREFRDHKLAKTKAGSSFIDWYYMHGPKLADWVSRRRVVKACLTFLIKRFVWFIKYK